VSRQDVPIDKIREIAERVAASEGLELVDVELHGRGLGSVLRIFLDKPGGVTHGDCQIVSQQLGTIFDVEDLFPARYTLEVSSPGLDRRLIKLEDYQRFAGKKIKCCLHIAREGRRQFQGRLLGLQEGQVQIEVEGGGRLKVAPKEIERANLVPEFPEPSARRFAPTRRR
jgi:ribosome maturation factor RimP